MGRRGKKGKMAARVSRIVEILDKKGVLIEGPRKNEYSVYNAVAKDIPELKVAAPSRSNLVAAFNCYEALHDPNVNESKKKVLLDDYKFYREKKLLKIKAKRANRTDIHPDNYTAARTEFFNSPQWLSLRYQILREQEGKCQCCGKSARDGAVLQVDHIIPLSLDWSKRLEPSNLQVLCRECNFGKSNVDATDWRKASIKRTGVSRNENNERTLF